MADTKMLQLILDKVTQVDRKVDSLGKKVDKRFDVVDKRIDNLGLQLARLEDDSPTLEEFDDHEKRLKRLEKHTASA